MDITEKRLFLLTAKNQTPEDWAAIDSQATLLPGDTGEHDFKVNKPISEVYERLNCFAENCGGLAIKQGNTIELCDANCGNWLIEFSSDGSQVSKVTDLYSGSTYWDSSNPRALADTYQTGNC